jgi:hypothetical protein
MELLGIDPDRKDYKGSGFVALKDHQNFNIVAAVGSYDLHVGLSVALTEANDFIQQNLNVVEKRSCYFSGEKRQQEQEGGLQ